MTKIILGDNQTIFRTGAAKVLATEDDFRIVAQCEDAARLQAAIEAFKQSVVLVAQSICVDSSKFAAMANGVGSRAILITDETGTSQNWMAAGFYGAMRRNVTGNSLVSGIRQVARGEKYFAPSDVAMSEEADAVGARVRDRLTPKEMRIVGLIVQGCKNKEIAATLSTTEQVIKNYLRSIYDKTGVSDRLELALFTIHHRTLAEAAQKAGGALLQQAG